MTGFFVVRKWMGVRATPFCFQTRFLIRNCNPFQLCLSPRSKDKKASFLYAYVDKVSDWERYYVFVDHPANRPFDFLPWPESLPSQTLSNLLVLDKVMLKLHALFEK